MGELPKPWEQAAERAGVRTTYRGIGDAAGISHVTVKRLITEGRTSTATVRKVAEALGVTSAAIHEWANLPTSEWGPWDPPKQAHQLNPRARAALEELILAITEGEASWSGDTSGEDEVPAGVVDMTTRQRRAVEDAQPTRTAARTRKHGTIKQDESGDDPH